MSCIYKIKEGYETFTETEKRLADYIFKNKNEVLNLSAKDFGKRVDASAAAVVRFSKKIGFKGYTDFKVSLAQDKESELLNFDEIIREKDSIDMLIKKAKSSNLSNIEKTYRLINSNHIKEASQKILDAEKIYILGVGGSGIVCDDFFYKLSRIKTNVKYNKDSHIQLTNIAHISNKDVVVAISYSGNTKEVNVGASFAKDKGATVISITKVSKSKLSKLSDILLSVPSEEKEIRLGAVSSRFSSLIITDLLYYSVAKFDVTNTKEKIIETRNIVNELK